MEKYSFKWLLRLSNSIFGHEKTRVERKMNLISWENGASFQDQSQSVVILKWNSGLRSTIFNGSTVQMSVESNSDCFGLSLLRDWLRETRALLTRPFAFKTKTNEYSSAPGGIYPCSDRLRTGKKTRAFFSTNRIQTKTNWRFPALWTVGLFLLWIFIGSC